MTPEQQRQMRELIALGRGKLRAGTRHDLNRHWFYITEVFIKPGSGRVIFQCWWKSQSNQHWNRTSEGIDYGDYILSRAEEEVR